MEIPEEYNKLLDNKILTTEIIADVLHSFNKRAKNSRDIKQAYYDKAQKINSTFRNADTSRYHESVDIYRDKEWDYYDKKEYILKTLFKPIELHAFGEVQFLYFQVKDSGFHIPCFNYERNESKIYPDLELVELENFKTFGKDNDELLTDQFCNKVFEIIKEGDFVLLNENIL